MTIRTLRTLSIYRVYTYRLRQSLLPSNKTNKKLCANKFVSVSTVVGLKDINSSIAGISGPLAEKYVSDCKNTDLSQRIKAFLGRHNELAKQQYYYMVVSEWNYATNMTQENRDNLLKASERFSNWHKLWSLEARRFNWTQCDRQTQRQLQKIAFLGTAALEGEDGLMFTRVLNQMQTIYSTAKVCIAGECGLELDPDLAQKMTNFGNYSQLVEVWLKWREASGRRVRQPFLTYLHLANKAAQLNPIVGATPKLRTLTDLWLFQWETPDIREQMEKLLKQLMPFYQRLHAYVRIKLNDALPNKMPKDLTIPAHLLGNMWAQQWTNVIESVRGVDPYPNILALDVTQALIRQNFTSIKMFEMAEKFFTGLGFDKMSRQFWQKSILEKPKDGRQIICHASAWDFFIGDDFRIKQCTRMDMESLIKAHHEMGHIQYYIQYKDQAIPFRDGANPGFHEAIGDLIALSVSTPMHLHKWGLLDMKPVTDMDQVNLKFQLKMALDKLAFLPFAYIVDKWRDDIFSGRVAITHMNRHWWSLRGEYQGISPPVTRSERDFDPGSKYHVANSVEYMRYFVSHILQFQLHRVVCRFGQKDVPLHECDIDGDKRAGNKLRQILSKGSSEEWPQLLKRLTGERELNAQPMLEYFEPLHNFLDQQLKGVKIGWNFSVDDYFDSESEVKPIERVSFKSWALALIVLIVLSILVALYKANKRDRSYQQMLAK